MDKLYVGSSDGKVHQLNLTSGVDEKQFTVGPGTYQVGDVSTETGNEIFVPTTEGTLYKLPLPLP
jgi:chitodextrinase